MTFFPRSARREKMFRAPLPGNRLCQLPCAFLNWRLGLCVGAIFLVGCVGGKTLPFHPAATGGNAQRGKSVIAEYRCGSCHEIPGIRNADGHYGPPLDFMARTTYIAGVTPNSPENLVHWIQSPTAIKPNTTMPVLGLSEQQARDVAAYLETLH
jgi:cytochrome c